MPWQAARIEMPGGRRSWTVLDDDGDAVEGLRHWIVHLEQTHASPNTIRAYVRHVVDFANFLGANGAGIHEATVALYDGFLAWRLARRKDALPSPRLILLRKPETRPLTPSTRNQIQLAMERYLAWGNAQGAAGKNWYTDIVQLMRAAPVLLPGQWPRIALDKRAARRIRYKQAPDDPRNRLYASREGANRAAPSEALAAMVAKLDELPAPIPAIFMIGIRTGARAEDLHALLFDCLRPDPHDNRFMLFKFWQNKVSRWNTKPLLVSDPAHQAMIELIETQRERVRQRYGRATKYLFPVFYGKRESFLGCNWTLQELKMLCLRHGIVDGEGKPLDFSWHPLRHHRGTQMAAEGHDILSIMFELGHASPDMASMYVNKRLELKKNALLRKGGGQYFTIAGKVDEAVGDLLLRKETMMATRVCGGACTLPGQLGEWCEHAHACLTCRFFRADGDDLEHFRCERAGLYVAIEGLEQEARNYEESGQTRMADITRKRLQRNKDAVHNTDTIIRSIEECGLYNGEKQRYRPAAAREEATQ